MPESDSPDQPSPTVDHIHTQNSHLRNDTEVIIGNAINNPLLSSSATLSLTHEQLNRGVLITGDEGGGKYDLFQNILVQLAANGLGFCFISAYPDSVTDLLRRLPKQRLDDVLLIGNKYDEETHPINLLESPDGDRPTEGDIITKLLQTTQNKNEYYGPKTDQLMRYATRIASELNKHPFELYDVFESVGITISPDEINADGAEVIADTPPHHEDIAPLLRRLDTYKNKGKLKELFDDSGISIFDAVAEDKIILADIEAISNDIEIKKLFVEALFEKLNQASIHRRSEHYDTMNKYPFVIEQVDAQLKEVDTFYDYASQSRSRLTPLIAGAYHIDQLPRDDTLLSMTNTHICFRQPDVQSAETVSSRTQIDSEETLLDIPRYQMIVNTFDMAGQQREQGQVYQATRYKRDIKQVMDIAHSSRDESPNSDHEQ